METLKIDIIDPKAKKLLRDLAEQNLIAIHEKRTGTFADVLENLRRKSQQAPDLNAITAEVEKVRSRRYSGK